MLVALYVPSGCAVPTWLPALAASCGLRSWTRSSTPRKHLRPSYDLDFLQRVRATIRLMHREHSRCVELRFASARLIAAARAASDSVVSPSARGCHARVAPADRLTLEL
jgi:hypothetical protein